jgi:hypothetical protein
MKVALVLLIAVCAHAATIEQSPEIEMVKRQWGSNFNNNNAGGGWGGNNFNNNNGGFGFGGNNFNNNNAGFGRKRREVATIDDLETEMTKRQWGMGMGSNFNNNNAGGGWGGNNYNNNNGGFG